MGKIGIMGGTFDPIHNGHLLLGEQAYQEYGLDRIWYMPSGQPPHKKDHNVTDSRIRLEMTRLAMVGREGFSCSDFEVMRSGNTYTSQTLKMLHQMYPGHTFYFIIGADSLYEIEYWHEPQKVLAQAVILAAVRDYESADRSIENQIAYLKDKYRADVRMLHCREIDISSAELRRMTALGESIEAFVPESVARYIQEHHLYQEVAECRKSLNSYEKN